MMRDVPPLFNLGRHSWKVTTAKSPRRRPTRPGGCGWPTASIMRRRGGAFRQAQRMDPTCAMCFWGEALVLGPNINVPMDPSANARSSCGACSRRRVWRALQTKQGKRRLSLLWRPVIRPIPPPTGRRSTKPGPMRWAKSHGGFPDDVELAVFHAEAMMDTQPWDYWERIADRREEGANADEIVAETRTRDGQEPGPSPAPSTFTSARSRPPTGRERAQAGRRQVARR